MKYRTGFQCPDTGLWVVATYAFGKVRITTADYSYDREGFEDEETFNKTVQDTEAYCKRHSNKRCYSIDEADEYIARVSDNQAFGFESWI